MANRYRVIIFLLALTAMSFCINYLIASGFNLSFLQIDLQKIADNLSDNRGSLWLYTILQRVKQFVIIVIIMKLFPVSYVLNGLTLIIGGFVGTLFSIETFYEGFSGILYTILCFFPQFIFYFINIKMLSEYYGDFTGNLGHNSPKVKKISYFFVIILVFLCGVFSEVTINQIFLKNIFQHLVGL